MPRKGQGEILRPERLPTQPASGCLRVACNEPCDFDFGGGRGGIVLNLSTLGIYLAFNPPLPNVGDILRLSFHLPEDHREIACKARVAWLNPPSVMFKDIGGASPELQPGCGLHFVSLEVEDQTRVAEHIRAFYHPADRR
jgi:hypothetical protein